MHPPLSDLQPLAVLQPSPSWLAVGGGLVLLVVTFFILARTRWTQNRPMVICLALTIFAHALLIATAYLTHLFDLPPKPPGGDVIHVSLSYSPLDDPPVEHSPEQTSMISQLANIPTPEVPAPEPDLEEPEPIDDAPPEEDTLTPDEDELPPAEDALPPAEPAQPPIADTPPAEAPPLPNPPLPTPPLPAAPALEPVPPPAETPIPTLSPKPVDPVASSNWRTARRSVPAPGHTVPEPYRLRASADRMLSARERGATDASELAVTRGLDWLASHQDPDGSWNAYRWGAGRGSWVEGRDRGEAGMRAETGLTGLAILAMLGSGHTHQDGNYRQTVDRGLRYLMARQARSGALDGEAGTYAGMYCHAMATMALAESVGMTGDARLRPAMERAVGYSLAAQHASTGGWRYRPGDLGDLSQFGWQTMALTAAGHAGMTTPASTRAGMWRFLDSVRSGQHRGLASYRPGEQVTPTMTAEALACHRWIEQRWSAEATAQAKQYLMANPPSTGPVNLYYWYYATLALSADQDHHWSRWNRELQTRLLSVQVQHGPNVGSWDANTVWGTHGGRVYSTAMATLCLEVYYRYMSTGTSL